MPRFKVKAFDGKTLTIEAPDESALDEAMSDYELSAQPQTQAMPQEKSFGQAFAEGAPLTQTGGDLAQGKNPYPSSPEGAGRLAGDIGAGAGLGASMMALGGPVTAAGIGGSALLNVLLEKSNISPNMRSMADRIRQTGPQPESQSVASNFIQRLPAEIKAQSWELAPAVLNMLGMGAGAAGMKAAAPRVAPSPVPQAAQAIQASGGQPTAAMRTSNPFLRGILGTAERSARTNPVLAGKYRDIDAANAEAVGQIAQKGFGNDIMQPVRANAGANMQGALTSLADERAAAYKPAVEAFSTIKDTKGFGAALADSLEGVKPEMLPSVRRLFEPIQKKFAKGNMTPKQVELEIQDLRNVFDSQFADLQRANKAGYSGADRSFQMGVDAIKSTYYNELDRLKPGLGKQLKEAKGDYAQRSEAMSPLSRAVGRRTDAPENIVPDLINSGTESLGALKQTMNPKDWELTRTEIARTILDMAKGKDGGISIDKLQSLMNSNAKIREIVPIVFSEGAELGNIKGLMEAGKLAGQNELGRVNPSGSGALALQAGHYGAAFAPQAWPALIGKTAADVGYTYAGNPLLDLLRKSQGKASAGLAKGGEMPKGSALLPFLARPQKDRK